MIHGCRTTHCHKRMKNHGGQFLLWTNSMDHWGHQLEKSCIKQKAQFSSEDTPGHAFSAVRGRLKKAQHTCQPSISSRTYYFDSGCTSHIFTCTVSIPRFTKFWLLFPLVPCFPGFSLLPCSLFLLLSFSHTSMIGIFFLSGFFSSFSSSFGK